MTKLLVTSDLHLTDPARKAELYRWDILPWLAKQAQRRTVDAVCILGDVTDRKDCHSARLVNALVDGLLSIEKPIIWVVGNHDYIDPENPFFRFAQRFHGSVDIVTKPEWMEVGGQRLLCLPHARKPMVEWRPLAGQIHRADLILLHQTAKKAQASNGQLLDGFSPRYFEKQKFSGFAISGDVHVPQRVGGITYCGSPHAVHFGDHYKPRVLLWEKSGRPAARLVSIPRTTIKRAALYAGPEEVLEQIANMHEGDQAAIRVRLRRKDAPDWQAVRGEIAALAASRGVLVGSLRAEMARVKPGAVSKAQEARESAPSDVLGRFLAKCVPEVARQARRVLDAAQEAKGPAVSHPIDLVSISITGFKTYGDEQVLNFEEPRPGLYWINGRNEVRPRLGGNDVGKSNLVDAIVWCIYGRDVEGVEGPNIKNWSGDFECSVELTLRVNGETYRIHRTQDPNVLTLATGVDPKARTVVVRVDQDAINKLVGLDRDTFISVAVVGQFADTFFDMTDTQKQKALSSVLGLDVWVAARDLARKMAKAARDESVDLEKEVAELEGKIGTRASWLENAEDQLRGDEEYARKNADDISRVEAEIRKCSKRLKVQKRLHSEASRKADDAARLLAKHEDELDAVIEDITGSEKYVRDVERTMSDFQRRIAEMDRTKCDACEQPISESYRRERVASLTKSRDVFERKAAKRHQELGKLDARRAELEVDFDTARGALDEATCDMAGAQAEMRSLRERMDRLEAEKTSLLEMRESSQTAELRQRVTRLRKEQRREKMKRDVRAARIRELAEEASALEHVQDVFLDVRLKLLEDAQKDLELETNNALVRLGLEGWTVDMAMERETKSGTVSRGFQVMVSSPESEKPVPWKVWAGGVRQRLRLAGALGYSYLVSSRSGFRCNVQFWDEPTRHLAPEGIDDLLEALRERAQDDGSRVFVIDHHVLPFPFDGALCATLTPSGSILDWSSLDQGE